MIESDKILHAQYLIDRTTPEYLGVFEKPEPKVSVVIATYNAADMLVNYSLKSVLNQTYKNLEIIVINDGSTDDTEELVKNIDDSRIVSRNIAHEEAPLHNAWGLAGALPMNKGLELCTGDYVCQLDDDDYFLPNKIEYLVNLNKTKKADIIHHAFKIYYMHQYPNTPEAVQYKPAEVIEGVTYACGHMGTSSIFYHGWFSKLLIDLNNVAGEPGDWNRCRRIQEFGAKTAGCSEILSIVNKNNSCSIKRNRTKPWMETL